MAVVWLAGLAAGFFGLLGAAARYGCGVNDKGLACTGSGSTLGVLLVLAVITVVTVVTVRIHDREPRRVITIGAVGLVALALCLLFARMLLDTV
jgi:hypothetical protein